MQVLRISYYDYRYLLLSLSVLVLSSLSANGQATNWELQIDKEGIKIFSRWKEKTGDHKVREIKATFTVAAQPEKLIAILKDADKASDWMVGAKTSAMLAVHSPKSWYAYTEFDLPWPLQNQDLVALYKIEPVGSQSTRVNINAHPDYRPEYDKIERMQHFEASWTFELLGEGKTRVSYSAFTYRKPSAPRWISDPVVQNSLWKTMSGFREVAED
ncbi:hypothetical protein CRP01_17595 [Flavilitoribacter nigricans DSM 23189 = NBRC 102662]|uniref:START domain-containing protein n=2 Tax=Flavilitoribacter TaxID=2762562 RepID=A0A2D0NAE1_FLAN2|nr:hypothetical protein CRP01_17595 [Flavilitoribacter nigricans DSM 23189 = NBRC 102662]